MNTPPQQPPYGQQPYSQPPYGQQSYGQPPYGQQPYGQPMYAPLPPGYVPPPPPGSNSPWGPSSIGMEPTISAGLGYLFSIIAIIFFFMEKRNRFVRFHNAQAILLNIGYLILFGLWFAGFFVVVLSSAGASANGGATTTGTVAGLGLILLMLFIGVVVVLYMVMWIWGMVAAFSGRVVKFPLVSAIAERWAGGPVVPVAPVAPNAPYTPYPPYPPAR